MPRRVAPLAPQRAWRGMAAARAHRAAGARPPPGLPSGLTRAGSGRDGSARASVTMPGAVAPHATPMPSPDASAPRKHANAAPRGLTSDEARRRLTEVGPNALPETPPPSLLRRFLSQFASALVYVLLFALAVDLGMWAYDGGDGLPLESLAIAAILLLNAGLGVWQEFRAEGALESLRELEAPRVRALRDGRLVELPSRELVPGDVVRLAAGGRVPADGTLDGASGLRVDEALLTGESVPVDKAPGAEAFAGTLAVRGSAWLRVERTGPASAMGRIAGLLGQVRSDPTPLERRLDRFGNQIAVGVGALSLALVAGGVWAQGWGRLDEAFLWAVALAVAAIPEGLPAVLALTLALGVERMSKRRAVVRRLVAVEALGSVTVIVTDKTGTLTENRMLVREVDSPDPERALRAMVLASDDDADAGDGAADPVEAGLVAYAAERGVDAQALRGACPCCSRRDFDSAWKFMRATVAEDGAEVSYLKGAPEVLLERCALDEEERGTWDRKAEAAAAAGHRVLGLAWSPGEAERALRFLGLVHIWDPPRPEVPEAVAAAQAAGVRVVMVTGDHPATARSVAQRVGIARDGVLTGDELEGLSAAALAERVASTSVFARVAPEQKLALVEALQRRGEVVAMTGDGVNDAPALKRADVGVAMGRRGSDVSREVADLVLLDDNFATIVAAIEEGRNIYENIQRFIRFLFSTNVALVLLVAIGAVGAAVLGLYDDAGVLLVPLTAVQLLWINILADGPPALAVGLDRSPGVMDRPPRDRDAALFDAPSLRFVLVTGAVKAALGLALLVALPGLGHTTRETRTAVFLYESLAQLAFVYPSRQLALVPLSNRVLNLIILVSVALQPVLIYLPGLRHLLELAPMEAPVWGWIAAGVASSWLFAELYTRRARARSTAAAAGAAPA